MSKFTPLQEKTFQYLTAQGHRLRLQCLQDLIQDGAFLFKVETEFQRAVEEYLARNPRGFCLDGIKRFLDHMGFGPQKQILFMDSSYTVEVIPNLKTHGMDTPFLVVTAGSYSVKFTLDSLVGKAVRQAYTDWENTTWKDKQ